MGGIEAVMVAMRNWDSVTQLVAIDIGEQLTNIGEYFTWLVGAAGTVGEWFVTNWPELFSNAFSAVQSMAGVFANQIAEAFKELAKQLADPFHLTLDLSKFDPVKNIKEIVEAGVKDWTIPGPQIDGPNLSNFDAAREAVLEKIRIKEEGIAEAKTKAARAAALLGKGPADDRGANAKDGTAPEEATAKAAKQQQLTIGLAEFAAKLQEGIFGKDKDSKRTADAAQKTVALLQQNNELQEKILKKPAGAGYPV
jgi:hypothetical protein